jgi:malate synthase
MLPKDAIKKAVWRGAYEDWNVDIGIETGVAQIGMQKEVLFVFCIVLVFELEFISCSF